MATIEKTLNQARNALSNATNDPQIAAILARCGYDAERLQEGLALYQAARDTLQIQGDSRFNKVHATERLQSYWKEAQFHYQQDLRAARVALKQTGGTQYRLQLDGKRMKAFDEWLGQAKAFYFGLRNQVELQSVVQSMGLTVERIQQGIESLQTLETFRLQQNVQKGSARAMQRQQQQAINTLERWMTTFRQYARLALASTPEYLVTLDLKPVSYKRKKSEEGTTRGGLSFDSTNLLTSA